MYGKPDHAPRKVSSLGKNSTALGEGKEEDCSINREAFLLENGELMDLRLAPRTKGEEEAAVLE